MTDQLPMPVTAPFSRAQRASLFNLVRRAAQAEIMPRFRALDSGSVSTKSGPMDLVTEADTAAEAMITRGLQIAFPSAVIVGEETASDDYRAKLAEAELGFLIDPIDGTWNFAHGLPLFGTMIAVCRFGRPVFGLIYDPVGRDFVWADIESHSTQVPTKGASRTLVTRKSENLDAMMGCIETNFMQGAHKEAAALQSLKLAHTGTFRCSAHQYRLLAQGAIDFTLATKLAPWDHAAGVMLCQQAGGHAAMLDGTPYDTSIETGYLLCAGDEQSWTRLAEHYSALIS